MSKTEAPELNLYVIPQHTKKLTAATVRIDPPKGKTKTIRSKHVESADAYRYFAFVLPVREPGTYRLTMTAGADTGCFTVSFAK